MTYKGATGHDNEAGFTTFVQQPACPRGIQYPRYIHAASGLVYPDGSPFCVWEWVNLTEAQYEAILTALGLSTALTSVSGLVTIATVTHDRSTFANYNATAYHRKGEDTEFVDGLFRSVILTFKQLEAT
jgi:hypothetical protein